MIAPDPPFATRVRPPPADRLPIITALFIVALVTPLTVLVGPIALSPTRLVLLVSFAPGLWFLLSGRAGPLVATDALFLAFICWFAAAMVLHHGSAQVERAGQNALDLLGAYLLARVTITTRRRFDQMIRVLTLVLSLMLPFAAVEAVSGQQPLNQLLNHLPGLTATERAETRPRLGLHRAQVSFDHPILFGVISSSLILMAGLRRCRGRVPALILAAGLSLSSAALLQVAMHLALIGWAHVWRGVRARWWLLFGLCVLGYGVVDLASDRSPFRVLVSYATLNSGSGYHRLLIWEYGLQNVLANPLFGIGLNEWTRPAWLHSNSVDSFWLLVAMWCGLPGLALLIAGIAASLVRAIRVPLVEGSQVASCRLAWVLTIVTLCLSVATVHVWNTAYSYVFFLIGAGVWLGHAREEEEPAPDIRPRTERDRPHLRLVHSRFTPIDSASSEPPSTPALQPGTRAAPERTKRPPPTIYSRFGVRRLRRLSSTLGP